MQTEKYDRHNMQALPHLIPKGQSLYSSHKKFKVRSPVKIAGRMKYAASPRALFIAVLASLSFSASSKGFGRKMDSTLLVNWLRCSAMFDWDMGTPYKNAKSNACSIP